MHADANGGERMRGISPAAGAGRAQAGGTARAVGAGLAGTGICAALALASVPAVAATRSPAAPAVTGATGATVPVIVFLKNQPAAGGGARVRSDQRFALV